MLEFWPDRFPVCNNGLSDDWKKDFNVETLKVNV